MATCYGISSRTHLRLILARNILEPLTPPSHVTSLLSILTPSAHGLSVHSRDVTKQKRQSKGLELVAFNKVDLPLPLSSMSRLAHPEVLIPICVCGNVALQKMQYFSIDLRASSEMSKGVLERRSQGRPSEQGRSPLANP